MVKPWFDEVELPETCSAVVAGPGLAASDVPKYVKHFTTHLWEESTRALIIDASGLAWLSPGACPAKALRVITPHPGGAARLLQTPSADVQGDRPEALPALSRSVRGGWGVVKGPHTVIGPR